MPLYKALFALSIDAILVADAEGLFVDANPAACELLGLPKEKILGRHIMELSDPALDFPTAWGALHSGGSLRGEWRLRHSDGTYRDVEFAANASVEPGRSAAILRDVTEKKAAERRVRESEARYQTLIENLPDVVWSADASGKPHFVSPTSATVYGYTPEEVYAGGAETWFRLVHADDSSRVQAAYRALFEDDAPFDEEYRIRGKDGEWIWLHDRAIASYERGGIRYVDGICSNVTARKRAEEAIKESEVRYRLLFEENPMAMWICDAETLRILAVNDAAIAQYGYTRDELLQLSVRDVRPPEDVPKLERSLEAFTSGFRRAGIWRHRRKDGTLMEVEVTAHHLTFDGRPAISALLNDVTERLRAERELKASREDLRALFGRLQEIREEERTGIAHSIHDELGQSLTALKIDLGWVEGKLGDAPPFPTSADVAERIRAMRATLHESALNVRRISAGLRPAILDALGLVPALEWQAKDFRSTRASNAA